MTERPTKSNQNPKPPVWMCLAGGGLAVLVAFVFGFSKWGPPMERASYDQLLHFGYPAVTNQVLLIQMDSDSYSQLKQKRGMVWGRTNHVHLLERLAADACPLVVFDAYFVDHLEPVSDQSLADALRKQRNVVLAARREEGIYSQARAVRPILPADLFLEAARTNWGLAFLEPDEDGIVRRHWPFSDSVSEQSLPWRAAELAGATLSSNPQEKWLRYYGAEGCWKKISYHTALANPAGYFRNKIVFIGNKPETPIADGERDEFRSPYMQWGAETSGGVEILITEFLNLMNHQWLRRLPLWGEALILTISGLGAGVALARLRPILSCTAAIGLGVAAILGCASIAYYTNIWFPWLFISAVQVPVAFAWSLGVSWIYPIHKSPAAEGAGQTVLGTGQVPDAPDYEIIQPAFAEGAYGKVWLVRNAVGQWQALKAIYREKFKGNAEPYEREFRGITRYKPFSAEHPGLLRVDFVSIKRRGEYFYYVMELGDSRVSGWEEKPDLYAPLDLAAARVGTKAKRLPARECARLGLQLAEALSFLHEKGLTHRDIKPQNIIFVRGQPKLADVGLVAEAEGGEKTHTYVGTPGYMPMPPEPPGTVEADIYALGMVLYVTSTGREPAFFPELSSTLLDETDPVDFMRLNPIIIKACHPDLRQRYASAAELASDLRKLNETFGPPLH
jgi:CHASE2 domain-containing sensor protein